MNHYYDGADLSDDLSEDSLFDPTMEQRAHGLTQDPYVKLGNTRIGVPRDLQGDSLHVKQRNSGVIGRVFSVIGAIIGSVISGSYGLLDRFLPPHQRAAITERAKAFSQANPKLSAFLGINLALTGIPLILFIIFTLTIFISSIASGLFLGLLCAVGFGLFCVGLALCVIFPIIFIMTSTACFLFFWGLVGYYLLRWICGDFSGQDTSDRHDPSNHLRNIPSGYQHRAFSHNAQERSKVEVDTLGRFQTEQRPESKLSRMNTPQTKDVGVEKHDTFVPQEPSTLTSRMPLNLDRVHFADTTDEPNIADVVGPRPT